MAAARSRRLAFAAAAAVALGLAACDSSMKETAVPDAEPGTGPMFSEAASPDVALTDIMDNVNVSLEGSGANYRAFIAEYITDVAGGEAGGTVLAKNVGNKQLGHDFVPNDGRRAWSSGGGNAITYAIDQTGDAVPFFGGLSAAQTDAAIVRGHDSWEGLRCSTLEQSRNPTFGLDVGVIADIFGFGGSPFVFADVQHAGWRDINFAGGILGVTFTFIWVDVNGPTDIDGNGKLDTAFREIYYDPSFSWADDGSTNVDVESVALHEIGHGLSQAHFGKVWLKNDGSLKASPRAVMNALYAAPFRALVGTDIGGHCSNWGEWPNN